MEFYKATKKNTGCGASFSYNAEVAKDLFCGFLNLIKQNGWNPKGNGGKGTGIFNGGSETTLKLSSSELGLIKGCIRRDKTLKEINSNRTIFHQTKEGGTKTLDITRYVKDNLLVGYTFTVTAPEKDSGSKNTFRLGLTVGESEELLTWLEDALAHIAHGRRSKKIKKAQAYKKASESKQESSSDNRDEPPF